MSALAAEVLIMRSANAARLPSAEGNALSATFRTTKVVPLRKIKRITSSVDALSAIMRRHVVENLVYTLPPALLRRSGFWPTESELSGAESNPVGHGLSAPRSRAGWTFQCGCVRRQVLCCGCGTWRHDAHGGNRPRQETFGRSIPDPPAL